MSAGCTLALVVLFIIGGIAAGAFTWALCRMAAISETYQLHHEEDHEQTS